MNGNTRTALGEVPNAFMSLLRAQLDLSRELVQSITGDALPDLRDPVRGALRKVGTSCCDIPPPCWMPQPLGDCVSHVTQCKTACIRLVITNCDRTPRQFRVRATGDAQGLSITPTTFPIEPMDCVTVEVCRSVSDNEPTGTSRKAIVWVEGCKLQFLRWTTSVGTMGFDSCHQVEVEDCPDYRHHWYDHFYCARRCFHRVDPGRTGLTKNG